MVKTRVEKMRLRKDGSIDVFLEGNSIPLAISEKAAEEAMWLQIGNEIDIEPLHVLNAIFKDQKTGTTFRLELVSLDEEISKRVRNQIVKSSEFMQLDLFQRME